MSSKVFFVHLLLFTCLFRISDSYCPTRENIISIEDVQEAVACSKFAYREMEVGDIVPDTSYKVTYVYESFMSKTDKVGIRVFIAERGLTTIVTYRGTAGNGQLLDQLIGIIKEFSGVKVKIRGEYVKVNQFFLNAFNLTYPVIRNRLLDPSKRYIITGHSLGGAMASLLALFMTDYENGKMWNDSRTSLITFGEPRVGNRDFAILHDRVINTYRKWRFILRNDPVPHIPPRTLFLHHSREILIDYDIKWFSIKKVKYWRVCNETEDHSCSYRYRLIPNPINHKIATYEEYIKNPPGIYKDINQDIHSNFKDAILKYCPLRSFSIKTNLNNVLINILLFLHCMVRL